MYILLTTDVTGKYCRIKFFSFEIKIENVLNKKGEIEWFNFLQILFCFNVWWRHGLVCVRMGFVCTMVHSPYEHSKPHYSNPFVYLTWTVNCIIRHSTFDICHSVQSEFYVFQCKQTTIIKIVIRIKWYAYSAWKKQMMEFQFMVHQNWPRMHGT